MRTITHTQVQELVKQLPAARLKRVYNMIIELTEKESGKESLQVDFMKLSLSERRKNMRQQAKQMTAHYNNTTAERGEWQSGDFIDEG